MVLVYSVLEQFDITKIDFSWILPFLGFIKLKFILDFFFNEQILLFFYKLKVTYFIFINKLKGFLFFFIRKIFKIIQSFFIPTSYSTKNYMYGKIAYLIIKSYLSLFYKNKILMFWRLNSAVVKVKVQLIFQQAIKTNFGLHYPYYNRLLNYYPYIVTVFFLIVFHNFNGLLFYGSLIQLFYYKIL